MLFFAYELFLLPSALLVYFISPTRRAIQASIYFLMWTQLGSLIVLVAVIYITYLSGSTNLNQIAQCSFNSEDSLIIYTLLFLGFGIKVPIWPAHYWLTKTHVEAPAGFSMYLSGFLVKTAVYAFFRLSSLLSNEFSVILFVVVCLVGVVDASLKM